MKRRNLAILFSTLVAVLATAGPALACAGADATPRADNLPALRAATLCLLNAERARRGLARLRANGRLRRAAERHSEHMADRNYFSHVSPGGSTMVSRVASVGYRWASLGENLAWGSGHLSTPREIVRGWMASPGHRANILRARFREVGIGISMGTPVAGGGRGATYTTEFGTRR